MRKKNVVLIEITRTIYPNCETREQFLKKMLNLSPFIWLDGVNIPFCFKTFLKYNLLNLKTNDFQNRKSYFFKHGKTPQNVEISGCRGFLGCGVVGATSQNRLQVMLWKKWYSYAQTFFKLQVHCCPYHYIIIQW